MVKRITEWIRAPEPRVSYATIRDEAARTRAAEAAREAERRRMPWWVRLAPLGYYALPVIAVVGFAWGEWISAWILASCGVGFASWPLEYWWRRRDRRRGRALAEPVGRSTTPLDDSAP